MHAILRPLALAATTTGLLFAGSALAQTVLPALPGINLGDLGTAPKRQYGTPTVAADKVCVTGKVPVTLPVATPPTANPFLPLGALAKAAPAVRSQIYAELCMNQAARAAAAAGKPPAVLLLTPGFTYGTYYWDFPYKPETYSTVNRLVAAGYATLNYDRLGLGRSAHPLSALTTMSNQATVASQLVGKLKKGDLFGVRFNHVGTVGHSYGSGIGHVQAQLFNDADAVFLTGWSHRLSADAGGPVLNSLPALLDARTASEPWALDPGYLMPKPGSRNAPEFYNPARSDPGLIAVDEQLANSSTVAEIATLTPAQYTGGTKAIRVPVFTLIGGKDPIFCGNGLKPCTTTATVNDGPAQLEAASAGFVAWDGPAFPPQACFRAAIIPESAHNLSLAANAPQFVATLIYFADQALGRNGENAASYRAGCAKRAPTFADNLPDTTRLLPLPVSISGQR